MPTKKRERESYDKVNRRSSQIAPNQPIADLRQKSKSDWLPDWKGDTNANNGKERPIAALQEPLERHPCRLQKPVPGLVDDQVEENRDIYG